MRVIPNVIRLGVCRGGLVGQLRQDVQHRVIADGVGHRLRGGNRYGLRRGRSTAVTGVTGVSGLGAGPAV